MTRRAIDHPLTPQIVQESRTDSPRRHRGRLVSVLVCLLTLPGCSGCQQSTPEPVSQPAVPPANVESTTKTATAKTATGNATSAAASDRSNKSKSAGERHPDDESGGDSQQTAESKSSRPSEGTGKIGTGPRRPGSPKTPKEAESAASPPRGPRPQTAAAALQTAQTFQQKAESAASRTQYGEAFELASQAWEAVHAFPDDSQCQALTGQLESQLELWGDRANAVVAPEDIETKQLVEQ